MEEQQGNQSQRKRKANAWRWLLCIFTLELLILFIAPMYSDYRVGTRLGKGIAFASGVKAGITAYYATTGMWPEGSAEEKMAQISINSPMRDRHVKSIQILSAGMIEIQFTDSVAKGGRRLVLVPEVTEGGRFKWYCLNPYEGRVHNPRNLIHPCR